MAFNRAADSGFLTVPGAGVGVMTDSNSLGQKLAGDYAKIELTGE